MITEQQTEQETNVEINFKTLLVAGAYFGHKTAQWNPDMAHFIYGARNGVHIIDINLTIEQWDKIRTIIYNLSAAGKEILLVGTKKQAQASIKLQAQRCKSHYIDYRWPPGLLTNFATIKQSVDKLKKFRNIIEDHQAGIKAVYTKKELLKLQKQVDQLDRELGGVSEMKYLPAAVFVTDPVKDAIAVAEARNLNIPVIALCDTNAPVKFIDYVIPSNDDATSTLTLFLTAVADTIIAGKQLAQEVEIIEEKKEELIEDLGEPVLNVNEVEKNIEVSYKKS